MKPVLQTETGDKRGNCLAACVASILDLPIEEVPNFILERNWWDAMQDFLAKRGLYALEFPLQPAGSPQNHFYPIPDVYAILTGHSPRMPGRFHAVVAKASWTGWEIVHDPHPEGGNIVGDPTTICFFGALKPEQSYV